MEEQRDGYVVEDWDITNLQVGEAVVVLPYKEPFIFKFDKFAGTQTTETLQAKPKSSAS